MDSCLDMEPPTPYSLYASYKKVVPCRQQNTLHGLCQLSIWKESIRSCTQAYRWALHKLGVGEWLLCLIHKQSMYENTRSSVCDGWNLREELSQCDSGSLPMLLSEPYTIHRGSVSPLPRVPYLIGKPVCRWRNYHFWIAETTTKIADPLENLA